MDLLVGGMVMDCCYKHAGSTTGGLFPGKIFSLKWSKRGERSVKVIHKRGRSMRMYTKIPAGCIVGQVGGRWSALLLTEFHGGGCYTGT